MVTLVVQRGSLTHCGKLMTMKPVVALIEDEPLQRMPLARALDDAGFEVVSAAYGPEGLAMLGDPGIDAAIVDIRLPGPLNGVAIIREARRRNPRLKAVLTSGQAPHEDVTDIGPFLPKPFRAPELIALVRTLLERGDERRVDDPAS